MGDLPGASAARTAQVCCGVCGTVLVVPVEVRVFRCGACKNVLHLAGNGEEVAPSELDPTTARLLEKKLLREACTQELNKWLQGEEPLESCMLASKRERWDASDDGEMERDLFDWLIM